jgi:NAD(P)-dependent dehydrogenase (short-subunit alcohol dehydrogenase family)
MAKKKWDSTKIPDQRGRVAIVTGASSGIGYETARVLAEKNATVIMAQRSLEKGNAAAEMIRSENAAADIEVFELDLASLDSVRRFAERFKESYSRLDLLINNAGVMMPPYTKTTDGFELQFGTNHLGHFALTGLLLERIRNTPGSRIVNVSSSAHHYGNLDFDDLNWGKRSYRKMRAYADSKIANLYFTNELQRRLDEAGVNTMVTAAHPGWTATELQRHAGVLKFLNRFVAQDITMGALPTLCAATAEDAGACDYFGPEGWREMRGHPKKVEVNPRAKDTEKAKKLWEISEKLTGIAYL